MALMPEMPAISSLPAEILTSILRFVGSRQLHAKLTVCKWWYSIAHCLAYEDITFGAGPLSGFPLASDEARDLIRRYVRSLSIELDGCFYEPLWLLQSLSILTGILRSCTRLSFFAFSGGHRFRSLSGSTNSPELSSSHFCGRSY